MGARSRSSRRWLREHEDDIYVRRARSEGSRSRAAYKLEEIDRRDTLLRPGMTVVDLGAAPGGWSAYAARRVGAKGKVVGLDLLPLDPLPGVDLVQGDFREPRVLTALLEALGGRRADLVLSDMAPNISGVKLADQARAMELATLALELSRRVLVVGGSLLVKVFQGEDYPGFVQELRREFRVVSVRKPRASRARSAETYLLARGHGV